MPNLITLGIPITPSVRKVEFDPKYIRVGVKRGYQKFVRVQFYSFLVMKNVNIPKNIIIHSVGEGQGGGI